MRYPGIHFDRMLTCRKHVETTALKCKKGLSVLKAMGTKGIQQRQLFLLYQSVVLCVTDCGLGLRRMARTNLLKLDRVQNEVIRVILGTTQDTPCETTRFMLDLAPTNTNHRKWSRSKHTSVPLKIPPNLLHEAVEHTKGRRKGRGKPSMGQTEDSLIPQVCQLTELKQTKEWERYPNRFRRLYEALLPENWGKHCREWPTGKLVRDQAPHSRKQQTTRPHNVH